MKKITLMMMLSLTISGITFAQGSLCEITVTGNFDSECLYDYKDNYFDEAVDLMVACQNSTVTYTAHANTGTANVTGYTWEVYGDVSHSTSLAGDQITVAWGNGGWGMLVVSVETSAGEVCSKAVRVKLIASPTASAITIPAYTVMPDGSKVIRVCKGETVQFIDCSDNGGGDIAGISWQCSHAQPSSTPTYIMENVSYNDEVEHIVFNNCGCADNEKYLIELIQGEILELDCYGTVCEGAIVEYTATNPTCTDYMWYVEGGTIVDGHGSSTPVVQWDNPHNGYGILGLDGAACGVEACPSLMSRKIPVISSGLTIDGDNDVCVGDAVVYTLPLFGSTEYTWQITPTTGVNTTMINHTNEIRLEFNAAGTYTLTCSYRCDFIDCGPHIATPLTISVKPVFTIEGDDRICLGNTCSLYVTPAVTSSWTAYDLGNANAVAATGSGVTFTPVFNHAGRYLVTAESATYCGPTTFVVEVLPPPPAPTLADFDPANRHAACPNGGITLSGTPSEPSYTFVWAPACTTATPQQYSGESVTVQYQGEVCNVLVYNYDREIHCMSTAAYVHQVDVLTPAALNISQPLTVCPGSNIHWGNAEVPDQQADGMTYEWTIESAKQYCASVQGSHQAPGITLAVGNIPPETFSVNLKRNYCGVYSNSTLAIQIVDLSSNTLTITGPDNVCHNASAVFTASGGSNYQWSTLGDATTGNPASLEFHYAGTATVTVYDNPYTYCTNTSMLPSANKTVAVLPAPPALGLEKVPGGQLFEVAVYPALGTGYSYSWEYQATSGSPFVSISGGAHTSYIDSGVYRCTVTAANGCSKTLTWDSGIDDVLDNTRQYTPINLTGEYNPCEYEITITTPSNIPYVMWSVLHNGEYTSLETMGYLNHSAVIPVTEVGQYDIMALVSDIFGTSYAGRKTVYVEAIPNITFIPMCDSILFDNKTIYTDSSLSLYLSVTNTCNNGVQSIVLPAGKHTYTYTPSGAMADPECTFTFTLTGIGTNGNITSCVLGEVSLHGNITYPVGFNPVTIISSNAANNNTTCDNTPIELTATLNTGGTIMSSNWSFGDGSSYETIGNSVFHTYTADFSSYYVNVTVKDNYGCQWNSNTSLAVNSMSNNIGVGNMIISRQECPNDVPITLIYNLSGTNLIYTWYNPDGTLAEYVGNTCSTYYSGNYMVHIEDQNYCKHNAIQYVSFLEAPSASFYASKYKCCVGDRVDLYGNHGATDAVLNYEWAIYEPSAVTPYNFYTPDISYTPQVDGNHTISLKVTNTITGCSSTATKTIVVNNPPAAPTLSITGSPCIADAPVSLMATGYTGEMHWSNGETGATADYYFPGVASGYYYDSLNGCPSEEGTIRIERQPDLDALLTGCYLKCKSQAAGMLPVYGLATSNQTVWWQWANAAGVTSGYHTGNNHPLLLPIDLGDHYLTVASPGTSCQQTSSVLRIGEKETCDCEGINVSYTITPNISDCQLSYIVTIEVCNSSDSRFCIDRLDLLNYTDNIIITNDTSSGLVVDPHDCHTFSIEVSVTTFPPTAILMRIVDSECLECSKEFSVNLMPEVNCEEIQDMFGFYINTGLTSQVVAYIDFSAEVGAVESVIAFWSEPPMVADWLFDGISAVDGLCMIDMALLSQMADAGEELCFYAIICIDDELCKYIFCIDAQELYETILESIEVPETSKGNVKSTKQNFDVDKINLVPNPALDEVTVVADGEVLEVVVMDMHGRHVLTVNNMSNIDISGLASGMYIVRVKVHYDDNTPDKISYLKLTKER